MNTVSNPLARLAAVIALLLVAAPLTHAFSYQGVLSDNGAPAQGQHDMTFQLLEAGTTTTVGNPISLPVQVIDGLFSVDLPFDPLLFDGTPYDMQISVRKQAGPIYVLSPPTELLAAPQALFADAAGSVPDTGLSPNVALLNQPAVFVTNVSLPQLRVADPAGGGLLIFGPTDDCTLGVDPALPGLTERDPTGFRLLGQNGQGCRLIFGPTMDCTVEVDPNGPGGLLLRDPSGVRILSPDPTSPPTLRFGPTDDCSLGIDPSMPGLIERDPVGLRLLGQNSEGCRLIFGPTMDCTVEVQPPGTPGSVPGLLLRDPSGIRILPPQPTQAARLIFGPTDDCTIGIDPTRQGLRVEEDYGLRLFGASGTGDRLIFGPTDDCTIGIDPTRQGLRVAENYGLRLFGASGTGDRLIFGPTDDCTIGIDPVRLGLRVAEDYGLRLFGDSGNGDRLIFGPTDDCTIGIDPTRAGLRVAENYGLRLFGASGTGDRVIFGPTDDCSIGIDPNLQGLRVAENVGLRLHGQNSQGCRLIFGPTMDCTVEIQPGGPSGLLLRDPSGIRVLPTDPTAIPQLIFGPTDECRLSVDPTRTLRGLIAYEPHGLRLIDEATSEPKLSFGPTDECRIRVADDAAGGGIRMTFDDTIGFLFTNDVQVAGSVTAQEFIQQSTRRLKDNIEPIENPLELIQQLQGVRFDWKAAKGGKADIGFIAEEVGKILPEVVAYEEDGINARGVNYGHLVAVAVEGIKAQQTEIETLRKEKADMESRLARLEALLLK